MNSTVNPVYSDKPRSVVPPAALNESSIGQISVLDQKRAEQRNYEACVALVPDLAGKEGIPYSLAELVRVAEASEASFQRSNPFHREKIVDEFHRYMHADFSFGGWLENRESVFRGTYMDRDNRYIHLGVDINAKPGATVFFPAAAEVLAVTTFFEKEVGWGTRIDLKHPKLPLVYLIGHLAAQVHVHSGERLSEGGKIIGQIGEIEENGYVDPHIHLQSMDLSLYRELQDRNDLDGYGKVGEEKKLAQLYPEPLKALRHFFAL